MIKIIVLIIGLIGLWLGADLVVSYSKRIASKLGISEMIIGLTIVSLETTLPEMATSISAGIDTSLGIDASGIIIGNVLGSIITNISLILGIAGLLAVITTTKKELARDGTAMLLALVFLILVSLDGKVNYYEGIALICIYLAYLYIISRSIEKVKIPQRITELNKNNPLFDLVMMAVGILIIILCADFVVTNAISISKEFQVSEVFIGLLIGLGTSLPELSVSIAAAMRKSFTLSLGNLMGANVTDPLLVLGLGAFFAKSAGLTFAFTDLIFTIPYAIAISIIALTFLSYKNLLTKKRALFLIASYVVFLGI
ncbi:MAG: calcium/sodium antiporter [archaeon]|nr:calcium/sodium antiporter [archaeon]